MTVFECDTTPRCKVAVLTAVRFLVNSRTRESHKAVEHHLTATARATLQLAVYVAPHRQAACKANMACSPYTRHSLKLSWCLPVSCQEAVGHRLDGSHP
jgi:hypothetical protein